MNRNYLDEMTIVAKKKLLDQSNLQQNNSTIKKDANRNGKMSKSTRYIEKKDPNCKII